MDTRMGGVLPRASPNTPGRDTRKQQDACTTDNCQRPRADGIYLYLYITAHMYRDMEASLCYIKYEMLEYWNIDKFVYI